MFCSIDVTFSVKTDRVNDQRVAFPLADRMSEPVRLQILRVITSIREHNMKNIVRFEKECQALRLLNDFERIFHLSGARVAPRQAVGRVVNAFTLVSFRALWGEWKLASAFLTASRSITAASFSI